MSIKCVTGKQSNGVEKAEHGFKPRLCYALAGLPRTNQLTLLTLCLHSQNISTCPPSLTAFVRTEWSVPGKL